MSKPSENNDQPAPAVDGVQQPAPPEQSAEVAAKEEAPTEDAPEVSAADRRIHPRRRKLLRVQVTDVLNNAAFPGWVVDRSLGGMCISVDHEIEAGTVLKVRPNSAPPSSPWVELRVQGVRPKDGGFDLGCEFLRTPTWEVLLQFG